MTRGLDGIKIPKLGAKPVTATQKKQAASRAKAASAKAEHLARLRREGYPV